MTRCAKSAPSISVSIEGLVGHGRRSRVPRVGARRLGDELVEASDLLRPHSAPEPRSLCLEASHDLVPRTASSSWNEMLFRVPPHAEPARIRCRPMRADLGTSSRFSPRLVTTHAVDAHGDARRARGRCERVAPEERGRAGGRIEVDVKVGRHPRQYVVARRDNQHRAAHADARTAPPPTAVFHSLSRSARNARPPACTRCSRPAAPDSLGLAKERSSKPRLAGARRAADEENASKVGRCKAQSRRAAPRACRPAARRCAPSSRLSSAWFARENRADSDARARGTRQVAHRTALSARRCDIAHA